jgi:hypothetical protein
VAIKRHEFHPKCSVAVATPLIEADRFASASASPSLLAPVRGTVACSAVPTAQRLSADTDFPIGFVAFGMGATSSHNESCVLIAGKMAVTPRAKSATRAAVPLQTPYYPRLFEAV